RQVVPAGAEVTGRISKIEDLSGRQRTMAVLNADFSPPHKVGLQFDELVLRDGKKIPLHVQVMPWSGQVMHLASAKDNEKKSGVASSKIDQAKQEAKTRWEQAMAEVKRPGKVHRLTRYAFSQLPARPQYLDAGAVYVAE